MNAARDQILSGIRKALGRGELNDQQRAALEARLENRPRGVIPARDDLDRRGLVELFIEYAKAVDMTVDRIDSAEAVPQAVADYLARENLPAKLRVAPDRFLKEIPWSQGTTLSVTFGKTDGSDEVSVTAASAGIAESGTLMLRSGPESPTTLNLLPDTHIVVLRTSQIVGPYEDAWDRLREGEIPRTVNLITGASRTGDIEQTIYLGAHGPRRVHIVLIEDDNGG
jgi:L-lactate dehydrogenase complex protein LldG